jgi:Flp pilus assembly protein TadD
MPTPTVHRAPKPIRAAVVAVSAVTALVVGSLLTWPAAVLAQPMAQAKALVAQGDLNAALRHVDTALAADARDVQLRFLRGVLLLDLQRNDEAAAVFSQMSLEFPELPDPFNNLALLHVRAGRLDEARLALETALRNDPGHRTARDNLGQVYLLLALKQWETLALQGPSEPHQQRRLQATRALAQPELPGPSNR